MEMVTNLVKNGNRMERLLPFHADNFELTLNIQCKPHHTACFSIKPYGNSVSIAGSSGVELAAGVHHFLKAHCNSSFFWDATGGNQLDIACLSAAHDESSRLARSASFNAAPATDAPNTATVPPNNAVGESRGRSVPHFYYQNVVTSSYSFAWWDWPRWEAEVDWRALHGINLAFTGQEYIWQKTWIDDQADLQRRIVARMRSFGMNPVFPAFAGFVPEALVRRFPHARFTRSANWNHFPDQYCCVHLLDPLDPLFHEIRSAFLQAQREEWGPSRIGYYAADTDEAFWKPAQIKSLLSGVPRGRLILVDLFAEVVPQWKRTNALDGVPAIWCMLHNFGGNTDMSLGPRGFAVEAVAQGPFDAMHGSGIAGPSHLVGVGICPEGIEQNPVIYDLMSEWAFRDMPIPLQALLGLAGTTRTTLCSYSERDAQSLQVAGQALLQLLADLDDLLATNRGFLLGPRLEAAKARAHAAEEAALYERNLRTQFSWGTSDRADTALHDYANLEWAGLISSYYMPRWQAWLQRLRADLAGQPSMQPLG
ncbi:hypothetical protein WJX72_000555 [[Myrmecia] bisecta]|uniref:Alpha-N-acetylglucosaminidase n=1 Tax=[Myrmecia] bisecta TaxID=41462 RepID=A0AAW1QNR1_9CHLO